MHNIFEATANYVMVNILDEFIYKSKIFSLEFLNSRLEAFPYNQLKSNNKIPATNALNILQKKKLKMSSSEMVCFCRYFALLVGDKVKDIIANEEKEKKSSVWALYIQLRKIVSIVTSPRLAMSHMYQLEIIIPEFLYSYKSLYEALKFKFHNMTHYIRTIFDNGPLIDYWTMRFESKHREHKLTAATTSNKVNILKTLTTKSQLRLTYMKAEKYLENFNNEVKLHDHEDIGPRSHQMYFPASELGEKIISTNFAKFQGREYKTNMGLVLEMGENDLLNFRKIVEIFVKGKDIYLLSNH